MRVFLRSARAASLVASFLGASLAIASDADVKRAWQLLDYIAVDYAGAVKDGAVASVAEFDEMKEFAGAVEARIAAAEPTAQKPVLIRRAADLTAAIAAKADAAKVAGLSKGLADALAAAYPIPLAPRTAPATALAAPIYQAQCAACHGVRGGGDGPLAANLKPAPVAFSDNERARQRSVAALYQAIGQGIEGTAMPAFGSLPDEARWALAFFVGGLSYSDEQRSDGERLWKSSHEARASLPNLDALARSTEADLAIVLGDARGAGSLTARLRANPADVSAKPSPGFAFARARLAESLAAYIERDYGRASDLALSAYLDGVEPSEAALATRDRELLSNLEASMGAYRSSLAARAPEAEARARAASAEQLLGQAQAALSSNAGPAAAFLGSFAIIAREGLEALLIVVAMLAFLRKAERTDMARHVHAGWIAALAMGAATWAAATYLVGISGANREVTEGLSSLFAALVLLSVGMWMHQKSLAGEWQRYIHEKLSAAMNRKSAIFMFALAFVAVYREVFECILFFAALWEQGDHDALLAGLAAGAALLAVVAVALLKFSARLPISKFFAWSAALVALLAITLSGKGVAALQEAGWISATPFGGARLDLLGIFPTAESLAAQAAVMALLIAGFLWNSRSARVVGPPSA